MKGRKVIGNLTAKVALHLLWWDERVNDVERGTGSSVKKITIQRGRCTGCQVRRKNRKRTPLHMKGWPIRLASIILGDNRSVE